MEAQIVFFRCLGCCGELSNPNYPYCSPECEDAARKKQQYANYLASLEWKRQLFDAQPQTVVFASGVRPQNCQRVRS